MLTSISPRGRVIFIVSTVVTLMTMVTSIALYVLYQASILQQFYRLTEITQTQASLIESVARFDAQYNTTYDFSARDATIRQVIEAHNRNDSFLGSGELTLSEKIDDSIHFILSHRHEKATEKRDNDISQEIIAWDSNLAEPERRALKGEEGTMIGLDYRGVKVLSAYQYLQELGLGIVVKIDLNEVRAPFLKVGTYVIAITIGLIAIGCFLILKVTNPMLQVLRTALQDSAKELSELRSILPICSYCHQVRDDEGYWCEVETYMQQTSGIDFSHSICPDCVERHHPSLHKKKHMGHNKYRPMIKSGA